MADIAVTTAITSAYDHPREDVFVDGVDYLFFTDEESVGLAGDGWEAIHLASHGNPRRRAKPPKLDPHQFGRLLEYEYVIWIDGGIHIKSAGFVDEILSHIHNGMVLSPHFDGRDDAYGEATIRPAKYAEEPLDEQIEFYKEEGYPGHNGLFECGVLARKMSSDSVAELGKMWLEQVADWSYQDQVSLPYCLWKLGYQPDVLPQSFRYMDWVEINAHTSDI